MYVYILEDADGSQYVGITSNLERRLREHRRGDSSCASRHLKYETLEVAHYWNTASFVLAYKFESYLKSIGKTGRIDLIMDCPLWNVLIEKCARAKKVNDKVLARLNHKHLSRKLTYNGNH